MKESHMISRSSFSLAILFLVPAAFAFNTDGVVSRLDVEAQIRRLALHGTPKPVESSSSTSPHVVIVGGGIGGLSSAYDARHMLPPNTRITVVSNSPVFSFTPSNPWVAIGKRKASDIQVNLEPILPKYNIAFRLGRAEKLYANQNQLKLDDGELLDYDYLIIATGAKLGLDDVPGLRENAVSVCTTPHAERALEALEELVKNPGPVVVGATQGASCFGPAYEYCLMLKHELRQRGGTKLVEQCPMTFVTAEPTIGHLGLGGAGESQSILTELFRKNDIQAFPNTKVIGVKKGGVAIEPIDVETGRSLGITTISSRLTMFIPPFHGHDVWKNVHGLTDHNGLILINEHEQAPKYPNIFGVGVSVKLPPPQGEYSIGIGSPKTGYMIESQGTAAVRNIESMIRWNTIHKDDKDKDKADLHTTPNLNGVCITDFGDSGAVFLTLPQFAPRRLDATIHNPAVVAAKIAFEKYFLHKIESGNTDPVYEKYMLKLLGIERTKQD